jgi:integrase
LARKRSTRRAKGQGSYWYDKKNKRHIWYIEHAGRRHSVTDKDAERAKAKFEALKSQVFGNIDIEGGRQFLRDYLPRYIDAEVASHQKMSTAHDYRKRADYYILPTLGEYRLCDLKRRVIVAWVNAMLEDTAWSLNSIRQALRLLQRALDVAVEENLIEENPAASVKVPRRRRGDELKIDDADEQHARALTPEQEKQLLDEVQRTEKFHGLYLLYLLALRLGLRRGELLGLRWKDIDFDSRVLHVRQQVIRLDTAIAITTPKTPTSRRDLPLAEDLLAMLREHKLRLGTRARVKDLVFPNPKGDYRQPNGIDQHFRRVCGRISLEGFTFHSLRKTAITNWRRDGVDLEVAGALAGHKGIKVTAETYSDPQMDRKRAAVEKRRKTE